MSLLLSQRLRAGKRIPKTFVESLQNIGRWTNTVDAGGNTPAVNTLVEGSGLTAGDFVIRISGESGKTDLTRVYHRRVITSNDVLWEPGSTYEARVDDRVYYLGGVAGSYGDVSAFFELYSTPNADGSGTKTDLGGSGSVGSFFESFVLPVGAESLTIEVDVRCYANTADEFSEPYFEIAISPFEVALQ